jgi:hypothetical protein
VFVEQRFRRDEESRRAVAALRRAEIREGFLQRMQPAVARQPLHGRYRTAVAFDAQHEARQHGLAIEQHRARAAFPKFAAMFGAAQIQIFTQDLEQCFVGSECDLGRFAVHGQRD